MAAKQILLSLGIPSDPISTQYCEINEEDCFFNDEKNYKL